MADEKKKPAPPPAQQPSPFNEMPRGAAGQARVNAAAMKAKIAFQGDDEFSVASLDPKTWKDPVKLQESNPIDTSDPNAEQGGFLWKAFRRVFGR